MIRKAIADDIPALVKIVVSHIEETHPSPGEPERAGIAAAFAHAIASCEHKVFVDAAENGDLYGYLMAHWSPFPLHAGIEAYVSDLIIASASRGRGTGSKLLEAMENEAKKRHCVRIMLNNGKETESFHRDFYRKHGYTERVNFANFVKELGN